MSADQRAWMLKPDAKDRGKVSAGPRMEGRSVFVVPASKLRSVRDDLHAMRAERDKARHEADVLERALAGTKSETAAAYADKAEAQRGERQAMTLARGHYRVEMTLRAERDALSEALMRARDRLIGHGDRASEVGGDLLFAIDDALLGRADGGEVPLRPMTDESDPDVHINASGPLSPEDESAIAGLVTLAQEKLTAQDDPETKRQVYDWRARRRGTTSSAERAIRRQFANGVIAPMGEAARSAARATPLTLTFNGGPSAGRRDQWFVTDEPPALINLPDPEGDTFSTYVRALDGHRRERVYLYHEHEPELDPGRWKPDDILGSEAEWTLDSPANVQAFASIEKDGWELEAQGASITLADVEALARIMRHHAEQA